MERPLKQDAKGPANETEARRAKAVQDLACADLVDAMGRVHQHRAHLLDLVSPSPTRKLFGRAVTISFFPSCTQLLDPDTYTFGRLFHEAMQGATVDPAYTVLVLASNGYPNVSLAGGTKLSRLADQGLAGVLTDGRLRDFGELATEPYSAWCSGEAVSWGGGEVTPYLANVPVVLSGVGVHPGQYVFCDSSGAVLIPDADIDGVLEVAHQIRRDDSAFREDITSERSGGDTVSER